MRGRERAYRQIGRLLAAALLAVSLTVGASAVSFARPSQQDLTAARAKLNALNNRLSVLDEQYNQARLQLQQVQKNLAQARAAAQNAQNAAKRARDLLSARAVAAYTGTGSQLEVLLGAQSFAEFTDRLEYVTQVAQSDADVAAQAEVKRQEAIRATQRFNVALRKQQSVVSDLSSKRSEIQGGIAEAQKLVQTLQINLQKQRQAAEAAARRARAAAPTTLHINPPPSSGHIPGVSSGAQAAVAAAYSALGTPYQWGGASPSGFDCSGLTMWSWAHGGVSLPHSSSAQYSVTTHIPVSALQPGDLVFFYSPIHHVGIYVGNDQMIHAPHEGAYVELTQFSSYPNFVGAGRPG